MSLQLVWYVSFLLGEALALLILSVFVWRRRVVPDRIPFVIAMLGGVVWLLADVGQLTSSDLATTLLWYKIGYLGIATAPTAWFVFLLVYTDHEGWLTRARVALLGVVPAVTLGLVWLGHDLFAVRAELVTVESIVGVGVLDVGTFRVLDFAYGPWFWVNIGYAYLLLAVGSILLARHVLDAHGEYRRQGAGLLVGAFLPWITNVVVIADPGAGLDLTPIAFAAMGIVFSWALLRYRLFELVPLANERVVRELDAGVVVTDDEYRIARANPAARRLLGRDDRDLEGRLVTEVLPGAVEEAVTTPGTTRDEVSIESGEQHRHLEVRASPLVETGRCVGHLIVLRDVTDRVLREQRLEVLSRVLRHNVRNDMNLVLGHAEPLESILGDRNGKHLDVIEETASDLVTLSEKARAAERVLRNGTDAGRVVNVVPPIERLLDEFEREHPEVEWEVDLPAEAYASNGLTVGARELLENAIDHAGGTPTVRVSMRRSGETIELVVEDDGPGIPEKERRALEEGRETALEHGSGLGLWLVNWIVRTTGGDLAFESSDLGGTKAVVRLPAGDPEEASPASPERLWEAKLS